MQMYRVSDFIADFVADKGIGHVFLLPGGGAMHLVDAMGKCPRITVVPCLHEQACTIAAEAYARINESFGVAVVTTGPGSTNAITGVAGAWIESVPMLVISGQVKRADMLNGALLRQKGVQEVDIVSIVKPITKYAVTVLKVEDIRVELERAIQFATTGRKGPVWIDVPLDIQGAPFNSDEARPASETIVPRLVSKHVSDTVDKVVTLLKGAKRPLVLAGHGVRLAGAAPLFKEVVEKLEIPVVTTWNALDLLPYEHPLLVGRPGVVALRAPNFALQNCDLLISLGSRLDNIITAYNPEGFARTARKVIVDVDKNEIEKLDMEFELTLAADALDFLQEMRSKVEELPKLAIKAWLERCKEWKTRYSIKNEMAFPKSGEINHFQAIETLSEAIPANTLICTGSSGLAVEVFYTIFRNKHGQRVFLTSGLGSMGYGLPAAIGACCANSCQPMVAIESDGSLQLNLQELATLRAFDLPICLIVLNNNGYASIRNTMRNYFDGRYVGTGPEADLLLPDLEELARVYRLDFRRINNVTELPHLHEYINLPRPLLIDLRLVANETLAPKVSALPQPDGSMVSMPLEDMTPLLPLAVLQSEMIVPLTEASLHCKR